MKKQILAIIGIIAIVAVIFTGCSQKNIDATANTEITASSAGETSSSDKAATKADEGSTAAENSAAATEKQKDEATTAKSSAKTTAKSSGGNNTTKSTTKSTTKAAAKATAKATTKSTTKTTTKATTKKQTTTVKNVSAKDVQAQVNSYIRSKGVKFDSSLNPSNSGWSGAIAGEQVYLNNGYSLKECKRMVDKEISSMGTSINLYCYYDGTFFYICYMMNWG